MDSNKYQRLIYFKDCPELVSARLFVIRQKRKTLAIHVFSGLRPIELRVPLRCPWVEIEAFLASKNGWIVNSLRNLATQPEVLKLSYRAGEQHLFLGQSYPLLIVKGRGKVEIEAGFFKVRCTKPEDPLQIRRLLDQFYKRESLRIFPARLKVCEQNFPLAVQATSLRVRKMRARWGSCSKDGGLCLNSLLILHGPRIIDFVIYHELCHLVHFNHNRLFYQLLDRAMPEWRQVERSMA